jgi:hypothetical protein
MFRDFFHNGYFNISSMGEYYPRITRTKSEFSLINYHLEPKMVFGNLQWH